MHSKVILPCKIVFLWYKLSTANHSEIYFIYLYMILLYSAYVTCDKYIYMYNVNILGCNVIHIFLVVGLSKKKKNTLKVKALNVSIDSEECGRNWDSDYM